MLVYSWKSRVMPSHSPVFASVYMFSVSSPPSSFSSLSSLSSFTECCSTLNHHCFYCTRSQSSRGIVFTNFFIVLNFISFFVLLTFTTVFLLVIIFITLFSIIFFALDVGPCTSPSSSLYSFASHISISSSPTSFPSSSSLSSV